MFGGAFSDYAFEPIDVVTVKMTYHYSRTGGLAGVAASEPQTMEGKPEIQADGKYAFSFPLPATPAGFRVVLNPAPLDAYLIVQPTDDMTPEQLLEHLNNGDFNGDVENK